MSATISAEITAIHLIAFAIPQREDVLIESGPFVDYLHISNIRPLISFPIACRVLLRELAAVWTAYLLFEYSSGHYKSPVKANRRIVARYREANQATVMMNSKASLSIAFTSWISEAALISQVDQHVLGVCCEEFMAIPGELLKVVLDSHVVAYFE